MKIIHMKKMWENKFFIKKIDYFVRFFISLLYTNNKTQNPTKEK